MSAVTPNPQQQGDERAELCLYPSGCGFCGEPLPKFKRRWCCEEHGLAWHRQHTWSIARDEAMRRADGRCLACGAPAVEVDHIRERKGWPMHKPTCLHHQDNLRALCHDCHVNRRTVFNEHPPQLPLEAFHHA